MAKTGFAPIDGRPPTKEYRPHKRTGLKLRVIPSERGSEMAVVSTERAVEYFSNKLDFTTGPVELKHMMEVGEDINIVDVRAPEDYADGHIPGAHSLPRSDWESFAGLSRDGTNIVYCYSQVCHLAASAARKFAENGFAVMELEGGFEQWERHNMPIER